MNLCLHFCFINIWLSLFDEATEIKSLIKRPYQNLSPINRIALEVLFLKKLEFLQRICMWAQILNIFAIHQFRRFLLLLFSFLTLAKCWKLHKLQTMKAMTSIRKNKQTNKQASKLRSKHLVLTCQRSVWNQFHSYAGYGYPELFCPAVKQHNIGADVF